jgi:ferredoxin
VNGRRRRATHTVELRWADGRHERIRVGGDETVVDAAEAADVAVPYGCLYGACGTCTAELLEGEMTHLKPPRALKDRALDAGYVLPCIATPETDCRLRVGHDIQAEVVGTPWK